MLTKINDKLDKLLGTGDSIAKPVRITPSADPEGYIKPSAVVERQEAEEKAIEKPPVEGRRVCPECGGTEFRTEEDKSQVLFQQGGMKIFAKKYICKRCGYES